ncbi:hypothetical protein FXE99_19135 [Vibrio mimicus]|nr:hypothetical protein FXE99_19135 [Vibrio mimicus]
MVMVVVFEFSVMRCQPLRRALCHRSKNGNIIYSRHMEVPKLAAQLSFEASFQSRTTWRLDLPRCSISSHSCECKFIRYIGLQYLISCDQYVSI